MDYLRKQKGLTLIGVLISSVILTFAFTSFMNLQAALIQFISQSNDEILAQSLANEALELVRGVRDANYEEYFTTGGGVTWDDGLNRLPAVPTEKYFIDINTDRLMPDTTMNISTCTPTVLDASCSLAPDSNDFYVNSSDPNTKFYRYVEIEEINTAGSEGLAVTATVVVRYRNSSDKVFQAYTELYNTDT
jgi:hypothetical protein